MRRAALAVLLAIALALCALAGCDGGPAGPAAAGTQGPAPLAVTGRVATGTLAGLPPEGPAVVRPTPVAQAEAFGRGPSPETVAAFERAGYVTGASRSFRRGPSAAAYSFVVQAASADQARELLRHLAAPDPSHTAPNRLRRGTVAAIPGSVVVDVRFAPRDGLSSQLTRVVFTDGPFLYQLSSARIPRVAVAALERDAAALFRRVRGRPAP